MIDGVSVLRRSGFESIPTDLPGEWATDGTWTVAIQTRPIHGGPVDEHCHRVLVYADSARGIGLDTDLAAEATETSIEAATRSALLRAGYPVTNDASR